MLRLALALLLLSNQGQASSPAPPAAEATFRADAQVPNPAPSTPEAASPAEQAPPPAAADSPPPVAADAQAGTPAAPGPPLVVTGPAAASATTTPQRPAPSAAPQRRDCGVVMTRQSRGAAIAGAAASTVLGFLIGRNVPLPALAAAALPFNAFLVDSFADLLDCREQQQAIMATQQAIDETTRDGIRTAVIWRSETRPNVTGRTEVTAIDPVPARPRQPRCMTVTDIAIIDGQEVVVPKRMCRTPPSTRWVRAATSA